MNLINIRTKICGWCDNGTHWEWEGPGPTDGYPGPCYCLDAPWTELIKDRLRSELRILGMRYKWLKRKS